MKKFRYRLEKVLNFKEQIERQKRLILSEKNQALTLEKSRLMDLTAKSERYHRIYSSFFTGRVNLAGLKAAKSYLDRIKGDMFRQAERVVNAEKAVNHSKIEVREAMKDRKKYEKLKQRKLKSYDLKTGREEQKEIDEIASRRKTCTDNF